MKRWGVKLFVGAIVMKTRLMKKMLVGILAALALIVAGPTVQAQRCAPPPSGLVSWWPGDGNANDVWDGNNGQLLNGTTFAAGRVGRAFSFDGIDDNVFIGNPTNLQLSQSDYTVDVWVNLTSLNAPPGHGFCLGPGCDFTIVSKMGLNVNRNGWRLLKQSNNHLWFIVGAPNVAYDGAPNVIQSTNAVTAGEWYHVAAVKTSQTISLYVNGELQESKPLPADYTDDDSADVVIGQYPAEPAGSMFGLIDEIEIFNRALSEDEIKKIFQEGKCKPGTLISFWSMFVGSSWVYNGSSVSDTWTYRAEVTSQDTTTIPGVETYVVSGFEGMTPWDKQWVSINSYEMRQWRYDSWGEEFNTVRFDGGFVLAKNPVIVGDQWIETGNGTFNGIPVTISTTTTVESFDIVTVPLGTFEAYKICREITILDVLTLTEYRWFVPYIGFIKMELQEPEEEAETEVLASMVLNGFTDVPFLYWAYDYVMAIYDAGITVGCAQDNPGTPENERKYCPEDNVTRGQMAAFIIRSIYGESFSYTTQPYFGDVPSDHTFFKYVQKMKDTGITAVTGTYDVEGTVTRGQMAAFIIRALYGESFAYTQASYFADVPSTHDFFKYVQKMKDTGITVVTGTYDVEGTVTRAQMAAFLSRAFLEME